MFCNNFMDYRENSSEEKPPHINCVYSTLYKMNYNILYACIKEENRFLTTCIIIITER